MPLGECRYPGSIRDAQAARSLLDTTAARLSTDYGQQLCTPGLPALDDPRTSELG